MSNLKVTSKKFIIGIVLGIFLISFISAVEVSYCCEKTNDGAWCQNAPEGDCSLDYRKVPTSCEATSYCKLGCCYNSQEGTCMENTPQKICEEPADGISGGVWSESKECEIPQCSLGCCLIGDQAAFVTQTRCKRLASLYGLEIDFRTNIQSELECIASATSDVKGACVFEKEFEKTCLFLSKKDCLAMTDSDFHEGYLCSAETLGTNCGPTQQTTCVDGRDEVYFVDSCGNLANIYDALKINNKIYWSEIVSRANSCGSEDANGNADSSTCGSCDYYLGSTCKSYKRGQDKKPTYGDNICRDLSCEYEGKKYNHGETWCSSSGSGTNMPGSRYFRLICYNNEVTVEPCADFRQEICIESDIGGFKTAGCRVNMWQDCVTQDNKEDCKNIDKRDCQWMNSKCVPNFAPGLDFWEIGGDAESLCNLASTTCIVKYEKKIGGDKECVENCECIGGLWEAEMNKMCNSLGDCGVKKNFMGIEGYSSKSAINRSEA